MKYILARFDKTIKGYKEIDPEKLASEKYEANIADDGQFPNHTDKDIWMSGFKAAIDAFAKNQIIVHHINNATTLH